MAIRLCLVLHNHQPVGNFDGVFEQAYHDSYLPFLEVFEPYHDLRLSLHTSGPLMEWLDQRHPEYLDRLARLVEAGRVEIIGGAFYEAILAMIPPRDRIGQIRSYTSWLENRLGGSVQGMWIPERVWEQSLTAQIADAGIRYTLLDDFHFKNAGLTEQQLHGYYITEDDGRTLAVFPGSEPLRYTIPFAPPQQTIDYLGQINERHCNAVVVFGDDGEKFGTWPDTKKHVYQDGWLRRFFDALVDNRHWIDTTTLRDAVDSTSPLGKVYLPDGSYREMTEWALPVDQQVEYDRVVHEFDRDPRFPHLKRFLRGGFWRNFKVKYPEANEMYARMMMVSRRLAEVRPEEVDLDTYHYAQQALYRGQCNCPYWHGAFGGIYLPHLRNAIYNQLIASENLIDEATGRSGPWCEASIDDYDFDSRQEVRLASDKLIALVAPERGGQLYELDVRAICHNLGASLARRPEAYHAKVLAGPAQAQGDVASIHDRVVFKQAGLEQRLQYDRHERKSLLDHFFQDHESPRAVARGEAAELGDFIERQYEAKVRRSCERVQVQLARTARVDGHEIRLTKGITLATGSNALEIVYLLENLPSDRALHFGIEFNFAGLPAGADDRYFLSGEQRIGQLGERLDLHQAVDLALVDEWLGIRVALETNRPMSLWTFPVETVSQSEGGFELVHQSVAVMPHWHVRGDAHGRWSASLTLTADTSLAEERRRLAEEQCATLALR
jgi:alpha-amylase